MSKAIKTNGDASVWAVVLVNRHSSSDGYETIMCATERDALVYAWFHNDPHFGDAQIIEMPLMTAEFWKEASRGGRVSSKGISMRRRKR